MNQAAKRLAVPKRGYASRLFPRQLSPTQLALLERMADGWRMTEDLRGGGATWLVKGQKSVPVRANTRLGLLRNELIEMAEAAYPVRELRLSALGSDRVRMERGVR